MQNLTRFTGSLQWRARFLSVQENGEQSSDAV